MSTAFSSSSGFCNCGNELLTYFELEDTVCSTCVEAELEYTEYLASLSGEEFLEEVAYA